jgi:hypothetical protein
MFSLLHPGYGREAEKIAKIRQYEQRLPSLKELSFGNQLEIVDCDKKSAYVAESIYIEQEQNFLSKYYPNKKFTTGRQDELINSKIYMLIFENVCNTKIPKYYRWLIDSGIYGRLEEENVARVSRLKKPVKEKEKKGMEGVSSLGGGLVTLFILCSSVISLALITFMVECRHLIWKLLMRCRCRCKSCVLKGFKFCRQKVFINLRKRRNTRVVKPFVRN